MSPPVAVPPTLPGTGEPMPSPVPCDPPAVSVAIVCVPLARIVSPPLLPGFGYAGAGGPAPRVNINVLPGVSPVRNFSRYPPLPVPADAQISPLPPVCAAPVEPLAPYMRIQARVANGGIVIVVVPVAM